MPKIINKRIITPREEKKHKFFRPLLNMFVVLFVKKKQKIGVGVDNKKRKHRKTASSSTHKIMNMNLKIYS